MVGKRFRQGPCRDSRNNLQGRRHQSWGHTHDGQKRVLALRTLKNTVCPLPSSSLLPLAPILLSGVSGLGCRLWGVGHRTQSMSCLWVRAAPAERWVSVPAPCPVLCEALHLLEERAKSSKGAGSMCGFFFFFTALTH